MIVTHGDTVRLASGILYPSRIGAIGIEVTNFEHDSLRTDIDVLGIASTLVGHEIRTYIEGEKYRFLKNLYIGNIH